jgi:phage terminase large subunit GpA-like protein
MNKNPAAIEDPVVAEVRWMLRSARVPRLRTLREFAEQEIIIPAGPYEGRRFAARRAPWTGLLLDAINSNRWPRIFVTGPSQSGKTLLASVIPVLYHLFEARETVIFGVPQIDMAADKWQQDFVPVIRRMAERFRRLMPVRGGGSRGGRVAAIRFGNGATLRFMSGGAGGRLGDKARAGFTARVLSITETDGMDTTSSGSLETDKVSQLEARVRAWGGRHRTYAECTCTTTRGRTWREVIAGTNTRIILPCPHCGQWVTPEREHLVGWQSAENILQAGRLGHWCCPSCGGAWTEAQRVEANRAARLLHAGQEVTPDGAIVGKPVETDTLGFRWSAVNNLLTPTSELAKGEWRAKQRPDQDEAEKEQRQYVFAIPFDPPELDTSALDLHAIARRRGPLPRGVVPENALCVTVGVDIRKRQLHWAAIAWAANASASVVDYNIIPLESQQLGVERAILLGLRQLKDMADAGWPVGDARGEPRSPDQAWIDARYQGDERSMDVGPVYAFCRESGKGGMGRHDVWRPVLGVGVSQHGGRYNSPPKKGSVVAVIGERYHLNRVRTQRLLRAEIDVDYWKTWIHKRLTPPLSEPGAMVLFDAPEVEHLDLARHLTAEEPYEHVEPGRGVVIKWRRIRAQNHWLDNFVYAAAAAHFAGVRLIASSPAQGPGFRVQPDGEEAEGERARGRDRLEGGRESERARGREGEIAQSRPPALAPSRPLPSPALAPSRPLPGPAAGRVDARGRPTSDGWFDARE